MRFSNFRDLHDVYPKIREKKLFRSEAPFDFQKEDCFADEWIRIPARQDPSSRRNCHIQILKGKILKLIRH